MNGKWNIYAHTYTLVATGLRFKDRTFQTREDANQCMFKTIKRKGLHIVEVYNDKHYMTYCCDKGIRFYVQREM